MKKKIVTDKPWTHPELKEGETLLINVRNSEDWENNLPSFIKSVRRGYVAYTTGGKEVVPNMKPLFGVLKANKKPKNYTIEATCGDWFENVAQRAKDIATRGSEINLYDAFAVEFKFNDIKCIVNKDTNLEWLHRDYVNGMTMDWKVVGPACIENYTPEVQTELDNRIKAHDELIAAQTIAWRAKEAEEQRRFEEKIKGIVMEYSDEKGWDEWKLKNSDGYGTMIFQYAEGWAKLMQKKFAEKNIENPDVTCMVAHAENCGKDLDYLGITGFMYGAAVSILSQCWKHGEALRKWHNKEWGHEGDGVVNPAIFVVNTDKK